MLDPTLADEVPRMLMHLPDPKYTTPVGGPLQVVEFVSMTCTYVVCVRLESTESVTHAG